MRYKNKGNLSKLKQHKIPFREFFERRSDDDSFAYNTVFTNSHVGQIASDYTTIHHYGL